QKSATDPRGAKVVDDRGASDQTLGHARRRRERRAVSRLRERQLDQRRHSRRGWRFGLGEMRYVTMNLDQVKHEYVQVNGIRYHYAEAGTGPLVLMVHGFPELWYSYRHQLPAL